jgi:hypothetical protein
MSNTTKEDLVILIKEWVNEDFAIKQLQQKIKEHRVKKKLLTTKLVDIMKLNDIDCVNITEGRILYTNNSVKSTITKKHLFESLNNYFKDDNTQVENIANHILESRKIKPVENIKLKKK